MRELLLKSGRVDTVNDIPEDDTHPSGKVVLPVPFMALVLLYDCIL